MASSPTLSSSAPLAGAPSAAPVLHPRTAARDAAYLLAGLPAGVVTFSVLVTGLSLAAGLAITLLGIPVAVATLYAARAMGDAERRRAGWLLTTPVTRRPRPWRGSPWARTKAAFGDAGAWRDVVWGLVLMPLGTLGFTVAVSLWGAALGLLTSPLWYWALPDDHHDDATLAFIDGRGLGSAVARVAAGAVLIPVAAYLCRALADGTARAARALLQH